MASDFLRTFSGEDEQKKMLSCFLNYMRFFVKKRYEDNYWESHKPTEIIDISNQLVRELENNREAFPIDK